MNHREDSIKLLLRVFKKVVGLWATYSTAFTYEPNKVCDRIHQVHNHFNSSFLCVILPHLIVDEGRKFLVFDNFEFITLHQIVRRQLLYECKPFIEDGSSIEFLILLLVPFVHIMREVVAFANHESFWSLANGDFFNLLIFRQLLHIITDL